MMKKLLFLFSVILVFSWQAMSQCGYISLIGEFSGWADDLVMMRDYENPDQFTVFLTLNDAHDTDTNGIVEMKFRENMEWDVNWGSTDFPTGTGEPGGENIPVPLDTVGITTDYIVTFNCSTGEYSFTHVWGAIGLVGEINEWGGTGPDHALTRDPNDPDLWTTIISLDTTSSYYDPPDIVDLKFRENSDWAVNWGGDEFPADTGYQDGPNILVPIDTAALSTDYYITFNAATGDYVFTETSGPISMIGAFNGWNGDVPMNRDASDPDAWTLTRSWYEDSEVKFRENADWTVNWGNSTFPTGTGEPNGANIPLTAGAYDVSFKTSTLAYEFVENTDVCGEIGLIGDFNNWGTPENTEDPPTDAWMLRDPMYPSQFYLNYNFTGSTNLWFREDADILFNDVWGGEFPADIGVQGVEAPYIAVPGGKYDITFNCQSKEFSFTRLGSSVSAPEVFAIEVDGVLNETDWSISQNVAQVVDGTA
jgi:hypothetical protein